MYDFLIKLNKKTNMFDLFKRTASRKSGFMKIKSLISEKKAHEYIRLKLGSW
jgi:hypothetical protein